MTKLLWIVFLCFSITSTNAQSAEETLEWINIKKVDISPYECYSKKINDNYAKKTFEFNSAYFKVTDEKGGYVLGLWKEIKDVKKETI